MDASYSSDHTALLLIDPYNDFLSEGGKLYGLAREIIEKVELLAHLRAIDIPGFKNDLHRGCRAERRHLHLLRAAPPRGAE